MPAKWAGLAASCALLVASTAGWIQGQEQAADKTVAADESEIDRPASPLDRLRSRAPQQRWEQLRHPEYDPTLREPAAPTPKGFAADEDRAIGVFQTLSRPNRRSAIAQDRFLPNNQTTELTPEAQQEFALPHSGEYLDIESRQHRSAAPTMVEYQAIEDSTDDLEISREFPEADRATANDDSGYYTIRNSDEADQDPIYDEIEDEFPRLRVTAPRTDEFLPPIEQPAIEDPLFEQPPAEQFPLEELPVSTPAAPASVAQLPDYNELQSGKGEIKDMIDSPKDIKPLSDIKPYFDYEPDPEIRATDPYRNIFPRPDEIVEKGDQKQFPDVVDLGEEMYQQRNFAHVDFYWEASDLYHYPLYFEDAAFERYGHTYDWWWFQPFASFGTFGLQFFGLPYQMSLHPMWEKNYELGYYRAGEYVPYLWYQVPWNTDAAVRTGAFWTGMIYAFP